MNILHITPHLGGGVGNAHAAMSVILDEAVEQTFLLLEQPQDRRYVDVIAASGAQVATARDLNHFAEAARAADIVQFEFWNHPRLFECLARTAFPRMRSIFWSHISGLSKPVIQPGLIEQAGRFVFSTEASLGLPSLPALSKAARSKVAVINSGFGFPAALRPERVSTGQPTIAYLGTVDFQKMHDGFFDAIDRLERSDVRVSIWGSFDPSGAVVARARAMSHPERIQFCGHTSAPAAMLAEADILFYPLRREHYGTAENALVEAMSLGLTPVVLDNPAEMAIVKHEETGFVAQSIDECVVFLERLLASPDLRREMGQNAARAVERSKTPERSARQFVELWLELMSEPTGFADFRSVIGACPAEWFLASQCHPGEKWETTLGSGTEGLSKGTLAHFESVFPDDASLARLRIESAARD